MSDEGNKRAISEAKPEEEPEVKPEAKPEEEPEAKPEGEPEAKPGESPNDKKTVLAKVMTRKKAVKTDPAPEKGTRTDKKKAKGKAKKKKEASKPRITDAPEPTAVPELAIGQIFGKRFRVRSVLGKGAVGTVYEGTDEETGNKVAIKRLHRSKRATPELVKRFTREIETTQALDHPNIVKVVGSGLTPDKTLYMAMERLDGATLKEALAEQSPFPPKRALALGRQILEGLEAAHGAGIIHRDLKPGNIVLSPHPADPARELVKIVDFGIARNVEDPEASTLTQAGAVFGTPAYMAPEQAAGHDVDRRTDLYAVAVLLYEMLSGERPFDDTDPMRLIKKQISAPPPPLSERFPELAIPSSLEGAVMLGLQKEPGKRFQTASDFLLALDLATRALEAPVERSDGAAAALGPAWREAQRRLHAVKERTLGWVEDQRPTLDKGRDWVRTRAVDPARRAAEPVITRAEPLVKRAAQPLIDALRPWFERVPQPYRRWLGPGFGAVLLLLLIVWIWPEGSTPMQPFTAELEDGVAAGAEVPRTAVGDDPWALEASPGEAATGAVVVAPLATAASEPETAEPETADPDTTDPETAAPSPLGLAVRDRLPVLFDRSEEDVLDEVLGKLALESDAEHAAAAAMRAGDTLGVIRSLKGEPATLAVRFLRGRALALQDRWREALGDLEFSFGALPALRRDDVLRDRALTAAGGGGKSAASARATLDALGDEAAPAIARRVLEIHAETVPFEARVETGEKLSKAERKQLAKLRRSRRLHLEMLKGKKVEADLGAIYVAQLKATTDCVARKAILWDIKKYGVVAALPELERISTEKKGSIRCLEKLLAITIPALEKKRDGG